MKLFFIRHGETNVNVNGGVHTQSDANGLNENGKLQINRAANKLMGNELEKVFCSPELRAIESAKILGEVLKTDIVIESNLKERNWGDWAILDWLDIKSRLDAMSIEERYLFVPPGGESWEQMESRLKNCINNISKMNYMAVAVVVHEGAMRSIMPYLTYKDKSESLNYNFANGSVTSFEFRRGKYKNLTT